jgi:hypothetical protein
LPAATSFPRSSLEPISCRDNAPQMRRGQGVRSRRSKPDSGPRRDRSLRGYSGGRWWLHTTVTRVKAVAMVDEHDAEPRVPVEQAPYGLEVHPLPAGWTPSLGHRPGQVPRRGRRANLGVRDDRRTQ